MNPTDSRHDEEKPFLEHLEDLRWLVVKCVVALIGGTVVSFAAIHPIMEFLRYPLKSAVAERGLDPSQFLVTLGVTDPLMLVIQIGFFAGLLIACPFLMLFIGQYLLPALTPREKRLLIPTFLSGSVLFVAGVAFCYFIVLPTGILFFIDFNEWLGLEAKWTILNYISFVLQMMVGFGISFELPLVLILLAQFELVSRKLLTTYRRHAIVALVIAASCITPTSDPFNLALLFFPLYFLYEISILGVAWIEYRRSRMPLT